MESQEPIDEPDGIGRLVRNMGRYKPKKHEEEEKSYDKLSDYEDPDEQIFQLLKATAPDAAWREGLSYLMTCQDKEVFLRTTLAFLHNNCAAGINQIDDGAEAGSSVSIDTISAPEGISCADWMSVMEGLGFDLTSPGTVRDIDYVDVAISEKTKDEALKGFCCLMHTLLELSWTNLQTLVKLKKEDGQLLWETVTLLQNGGGIQPDARTRLEEMEEEYPYFLKCLGFRRDKKTGGHLQWEQTEGQFNKLCWAMHGLFRRTDVIESQV